MRTKLLSEVTYLKSTFICYNLICLKFVFLEPSRKVRYFNSKLDIFFVKSVFFCVKYLLEYWGREVFSANCISWHRETKEGFKKKNKVTSKSKCALRFQDQLLLAIPYHNFFNLTYSVFWVAHGIHTVCCLILYIL